MNIASGLAKDSGVPTLLMDLHVTYGDAAVFMGIEPRFSVSDAFNNMHRLDAAVLRGLVTKTASGADLLPSSERPVGHRLRTWRRFGRSSISRPRSTGYLVLDVPRSSPALLEALEGVGTVLLVANQELASVRSASRLSTALQQRYGRERVHLVVNRFDERAEISVEDVERVTGLKVRQTVSQQLRVGAGVPDGRAAAGHAFELEAGHHAGVVHALPGRHQPSRRQPSAPGCLPASGAR